MAGIFKVKVEGLKATQAALHELPRATAKNVMKRILISRAEPIADAARALVPVDRGTLRKSISVSTKLSKSQRKEHNRERAGSRDEVFVFIGPGPHPWSHIQEFGSTNIPPQPYMRPAWNRNKGSLLINIVDDLWTKIKKAAARRAKKLAKQAGKV